MIAERLGLAEAGEAKGGWKDSLMLTFALSPLPPGRILGTLQAAAGRNGLCKLYHSGQQYPDEPGNPGNGVWKGEGERSIVNSDLPYKKLIE